MDLYNFTYKKNIANEKNIANKKNIANEKNIANKKNMVDKSVVNKPFIDESNFVIDNQNYDTIKDILYEISCNDIDTFIIVTGGIGDFIAIDQFFGYSFKKNIIFLTKQSLILKKLLQTYNSKNKYFALYFNFEIIKKPGFYYSNELYTHFPIFKKLNIKIINISDIFPILSKKLIADALFSKHCFLFETISLDVKDKFNLPDKYIVISPYTEDNRISCIHCKKSHSKIDKCTLTRNFVDIDYINTIKFLNENNLAGVMLSKVFIEISNSIDINNNIINLSSKTTLVESIEILKNSSGYIGIDSFLSVIASKLDNCTKKYVKCNNTHARNFKHIYWYPNTINLQNFIDI